MRPKGNLTQTELSLLLAFAIAPLVVAALRISAMPGVLGPELAWTGLTGLGASLDQMLSLRSVPPGDRDRVLYLVLLPTGALMIAVARLTLGLQVIGFRAILLAVAFQETGLVPSLILIAVMVSVVMLVRPWLIRIRLPRHARLAVILCLAVLVLMFALLFSPWIRSEIIWRAAFFPVIILGLLAESIVKNLDQGTGLSAAWRTGVTVGIALLISVFCQFPAVREVALHFPELVLTQIVSIVLIAEFFDLQIFRDLDARLSGLAPARLLAGDGSIRVALVYNRRKNGVVARLGLASPRSYGRRSVRRLANALRESGHTVRIFEGDMGMLPALEEFIPTHPRSGGPGGIVLPLSSGVQGEMPTSHVPAMLEMAGLAYVGPTPQGQLATGDYLAMLTLLEQAGVPVPKFRLMTRPDDDDEGLHFPLSVQTRFESESASVVRDPIELEIAVEAAVERRPQAVVTEVGAGREIQVPLIGNGPIECLPPVELGQGRLGRLCPAPLDDGLEQLLRDRARAAFVACGGRDYAIVTLRVLESGEVLVVGIDSLHALEHESSLEIAAAQIGYTLPALLERILEVARERYRDERPIPADAEDASDWKPRRAPAVAR